MVAVNVADAFAELWIKERKMFLLEHRIVGQVKVGIMEAVCR